MSVSLGFGPKNPKRRLESSSPLLDPTRPPGGLPTSFTSQAGVRSSVPGRDRKKARSQAQGREERRSGVGLRLPWVSKVGEGHGAWRAAQHPSHVGSRKQPGTGSQEPGCLRWGRQGGGGGGRQCQPRGRCGPWHLPGTSACRSQSAVTREEGRERVTRDTRGGTQGTEDETRMSSLDACLLDLAVQGLGLPLVTTPCQGGVATEATG